MHIRMFLKVSACIWIIGAVTGCATDSPLMKEEQPIATRSVTKAAESQADAVLAQAKKDAGLALALLEQTKDLNAQVQGKPVRNLASVYRDHALKLRKATIDFVKLAALADARTKQANDSAEKAKWAERAREYVRKAKELHRLMQHYADLAAHPEKIAAELQLAKP